MSRRAGASIASGVSRPPADPPVAAAGAPPPARAIALLAAPVVVIGVVVGVLAVSTSAVLVRVADAPALALAFWRCAGGSLALAPFAWRAIRRPSGGGGLSVGGRSDWLVLAAAGAFLALHFALWISSLSFTTVAASSVLVTMSPLFVALGAVLFLGEAPGRRAWLGMVLALAGAGIVGVSGGGSGAAPAPLLGNLLAFGGAAAIAGYLLIGRVARRRLPVTVYATVVYGVAALLLLGVCLAGGVSLAGYDAGTWWAIAGMVAGPQLLGHTVFNSLLSTLDATAVAVVVLAEPVGATLLAFLVLGELPAPLFFAGAPLLLAGVYLAARS